MIAPYKKGAAGRPAAYAFTLEVEALEGT
jgi:hypothetical protein